MLVVLVVLVVLVESERRSAIPRREFAGALLRIADLLVNAAGGMRQQSVAA
ncbi:MAG TPA: hypothetical protein VIP50_05135 [Agromyces sp.]